MARAEGCVEPTFGARSAPDDAGILRAEGKEHVLFALRCCCCCCCCCTTLSPPVVFISGFADEQVYRHAQQLHLLAVFDKPLDFDELRALISNYFAETGRRGVVAP
jgi:hypothetical protein